MGEAAVQLPQDDAYSAEFVADATTLFRVLAPSGQITGVRPESLSDADILELYRGMRFQRLVDDRMQTLQRQGRISFYGAATGQEAAVLGSGYALRDTDWVFPALREGGILLQRGFSFSTYVAQLYGNAADPTLGRQMPCHYSSKEHRFVSLSSPIGTQLPQAVGAALAIATRGTDQIAVGYMGDGATSEGDFHSALHLAATKKLPIVFFCQNNQWAISVPSAGQTAAATFAGKSALYGMPGFRIDGNDALACYEGTRRAAEHARSGKGPVLIEALTYRVGAHSTSDDPSRYRDESVTEQWKGLCPIQRLRDWLKTNALWSDEDEQTLVSETEARIKSTVIEQERVGPPAAETLFEDVYAEVLPHLSEQREELLVALGRHRGEGK